MANVLVKAYGTSVASVADGEVGDMETVDGGGGNASHRRDCPPPLFRSPSALSNSRDDLKERSIRRPSKRLNLVAV